MGAAARRNFSIGVDGQVLTVREQRSNRDAMAAPRAAGESVHRTTKIRWCSSGRRGWESVHDTTLATLDEQSGRQVGPKILFNRPRQGPPSPPSIRFLPWGSLLPQISIWADLFVHAVAFLNYLLVVVMFSMIYMRFSILC